MRILVQEVRTALRSLYRHPGYAVTACLILGLAVASNGLLFAVFNGVILSDTPFAQSDRIMRIYNDPEGGSISPVTYLDWKDQASSFEGFTAFHEATVVLTGFTRPLRLQALVVRPGFLRVLGLSPAEGHDFAPEDALPNAPVKVLISRSLQRRLGPEIGPGARLSIDNRASDVIGVLPEDFEFPGQERGGYDVMTPLVFTESALRQSQRGAHWIQAVARLKDGVAPTLAQSDLDRIAGGLRQLYPKYEDRPWLVSLHEDWVGSVRSLLTALLASVAAVLMIAAINIAGLTLVRTMGRGGEFALRTALGASRRQMLRPLMVEAVLLGLAAAVLGTLMAGLSVGSLVRFLPSSLPRIDRIAFDFETLAMTWGMALMCALLAALVPALAAGRANLHSLQGSARAVGPKRGAMMGRTLIVAEVALALTVLVGAGLIIRSFINLNQVTVGYGKPDSLTFRVSLPYARYSPDQSQTFFSQLLERIRNWSDVEDAGAGMGLPIAREGRAFTSFGVEGVSRDDDLTAVLKPVTPGYFRAMGIPLVQGRDFTAQDSGSAPGAVIINRTLAHSLGADRPLGLRLRPHVGLVSRGRWADVVGVVADVRHDGLRHPPPPAIYLPHAQSPVNQMSVVVSTQSSPGEMYSRLRAAVSEMDSDLPVYRMSTLRDIKRGHLSEDRFRSLLLTLFAACGTLLASFGLYSSLSYSIASRTREIGLRMAVGAGRADIFKAVVGQGLALTLIGLALGILLVRASGRLLETQLFGVDAFDWPTIAVLSSLILAAASAASYLPARRAARLDPSHALRN